MKPLRISFILQIKTNWLNKYCDGKKCSQTRYIWVEDSTSSDSTTNVFCASPTVLRNIKETIHLENIKGALNNFRISRVNIKPANLTFFSPSKANHLTKLRFHFFEEWIKLKKFLHHRFYVGASIPIVVCDDITIMKMLLWLHLPRKTAIFNRTTY